MADQQILELIKQQLFDRWNLFRQEAIITSIQLSQAQPLDECL